MVDYRLRNYWTIARAIRRGKPELISTMQVMGYKADLEGRMAALFVQAYNQKVGT